MYNAIFCPSFVIIIKILIIIVIITIILIILIINRLHQFYQNTKFLVKTNNFKFGTRNTLFEHF